MIWWSNHLHICRIPGSCGTQRDLFILFCFHLPRCKSAMKSQNLVANKCEFHMTSSDLHWRNGEQSLISPSLLHRGLVFFPRASLSGLITLHFYYNKPGKYHWLEYNDFPCKSKKGRKTSVHTRSRFYAGKFTAWDFVLLFRNRV